MPVLPRTDPILTQLAELAHSLEEYRTRRNDLVRAAVAQGIPASMVARHAAITPRRVYQILAEAKTGTVGG